MDKDKALTDLRSTKDRATWDRLTNEIKGGPGGQYPDWYYPDVVASGLADQKAREFDAPLRTSSL